MGSQVAGFIREVVRVTASPGSELENHTYRKSHDCTNFSEYRFLHRKYTCLAADRSKNLDAIPILTRKQKEKSEESRKQDIPEKLPVH